MSKLEDDLRFLKEAYAYASDYSTDPHTQTGVVIVKRKRILAMGANHAPEGVVMTAERNERPLKYNFIEHAERNAIYSAAKKGVKLEGSVLYSPWCPCAECARAIIQAGISEVVTHKEMDELSTKHMKIMGNERFWDHSQYYAAQMFEEAGLIYRSAGGKIGGVSVLFRGQVFEP